MDKDLAILELDRIGLPMPDDLLRDIEGMIREDRQNDKDKLESDDDGPMYDGRRHLWLYRTPKGVEGNEDIVNDPNYYDRIPQEWKDEWRDKQITKEDWIPKGCPEEIPRSVFTFILSGNPRFDQLMAYKPFWLYCEYARRLNEDRDTDIEDFKQGSQEWVDFGRDEIRHAQVNHLYALDRYAFIKDDAMPGGKRDFKASAPQALLCWLKNIGVNYVLAKGRQAAITSTEMACSAIRVRVIPSYKGVLVTDDKEETGKSIFGEKFNFTGMHLPYWMQPKSILHDSTLMVMYGFGDSKAKGQRKKFTTEFSVFGSKDTQAINGTSPTDLQGDEAQNISTIEQILKERRPTSWASVDGKMRMVRQSFIWGTASSHDKGKGAFEDRYKQVKSKMMRGQNTGGWIAVFFDAFCRPYMSKAVYMAEYKNEYMSDDDDSAFKGMSRDERQAMFASHFPMSDEDAFRGSAHTVVDTTVIKKNIDRILQHYPDGPVRGHFEPIYDTSRPMPEGSYFPYFVTGATFERATGDDVHAPIFMFRDREEGWLHNYRQGTDPIQSYTGLSRMASVIMAAAAATIEHPGGKKEYIQAPVCWLDHVRSKNPKDSYKQAKLMGMYYANFGERACPEIVEVDQGHNYLEFCKSPELLLEDTLVDRTDLPPGFQIGGHPKGIGMKELTKSLLHNELLNMVAGIGHRIWSYSFWSQLKNIEQDESNRGSIKWGTKDVRRFNDDLVIAMVLAYVNMMHVGGARTPSRVGIDAVMEEEEYVPVRGSDGSFVWKKVMVPVYA